MIALFFIRNSFVNYFKYSATIYIFWKISVYQKQQAAYGGPYGYAGYPPYYGSQYGPY